MNDDRLRTALFDLGDLPAPADLAGAALDRARRHRRRTLTAAAAGLVAVLALAIGIPATVQRHSLATAAGRPGVLIAGYHYFTYPYSDAADSVGSEVLDAAQGRYVRGSSEYMLSASPYGTWASVRRGTDPANIGVVRIDDFARRGPAAVRFPAGALDDPVGAWSPDGRHLLTRGTDPRSPVLRIIDLPSTAVRTVTLHGVPALFTGEVQVQWAPDGTGFLAVRTASRTRTPTTPASYGRLVSFDLTGRATGSRVMPDADEFEFSPDGRLVLIDGRTQSTGSPIDGDPKKGVRDDPARPSVYDLGTGRTTQLPPDAFPYGTRTAGWTADGRVVSVIGQKPGSVARIYDPASGRVLSEQAIGVPGRQYSSVVLVPHRGPLPPGALGL